MNLRPAAVLALVFAIMWVLQPFLFPLFRENLNDILCVTGILLIVGAYRGWRWAVDPPEEWRRFYSQAAIRYRFGKTFTVYFTYFLGSVFVIFGGIASYRIHVAIASRIRSRDALVAQCQTGDASACQRVLNLDRLNEYR